MFFCVKTSSLRSETVNVTERFSSECVYFGFAERCDWFKLKSSCNLLHPITAEMSSSKPIRCKTLNRLTQLFPNADWLIDN